MNQYQVTPFTSSLLAGIQQQLPQVKQQIADIIEGIALLQEVGGDTATLRQQLASLQRQVAAWEAALAKRGMS